MKAERLLRQDHRYEDCHIDRDQKECGDFAKWAGATGAAKLFRRADILRSRVCWISLPLDLVLERVGWTRPNESSGNFHIGLWPHQS